MSRNVNNSGEIRADTGTLGLAGNFIQTSLGELVTGLGAKIDLGNRTITMEGGLAGNGVIDAATINHSQGVIAPGESIGMLTVDANLNLSSTSLLAFELGAPGVSDVLDVKGNLTLDGILNLSNYGGLATGLYTLVTWTGTLVDRGLELGGTPYGYEFELIVDQAGHKVMLSSLSVVPEPASLVMLGAGVVGLGGMLWRTRRRAATGRNAGL